MVSLGALISPGCTDDRVRSSNELAGEFPLIQYNGQSVPTNLGPLPDREGHAKECDMILSSGKLILDARAGSYAREQVFINSCSSNVLSTQTTEGSYIQHGNILILRLQRTSPPVMIEHTGKVDDHEIMVEVTAPSGPPTILLYMR